MARSPLHSMLVVMLFTVVGGLAGRGRADAQEATNHACHYTIDVAEIPETAFPFTVTTEWRCPDDIRTHPTIHVVNGIETYPLNPPYPSPVPPCSRPCQLAWATIGGIYNPTAPGESRNYRMEHGCYTVTVGVDDDGAVRIRVRPCVTRAPNPQ